MIVINCQLTNSDHPPYKKICCFHSKPRLRDVVKEMCIFNMTKAHLNKSLQSACVGRFRSSDEFLCLLDMLACIVRVQNMRAMT